MLLLRKTNASFLLNTYFESDLCLGFWIQYFNFSVTIAYVSSEGVFLNVKLLLFLVTLVYFLLNRWITPLYLMLNENKSSSAYGLV